jgi:hypothetical protein
MKTRPNTTACLKLVVLNGGSRAVMVARATTECNCERTVASGHIVQRAACLVEFVPGVDQPPFDAWPGRPRVRRRLACLEMEVT